MITEATISFLYEVQNETEKALYIKVPYWKPTDSSVKKHKQLYLLLWLPKSVVARGDGDLKDFVIHSKAQARQVNSWTQGKRLPDFWKTLGTLAPVKVKKTRRVLDADAYALMVDKYHVKYNVESLRILWAQPDRYNVSDDDHKIIEIMMQHTYGKQDNEIIPYKDETYWQ
jgi:hypothetical protein